MIFNKLKTVSDVVSWRLCLGCGACVAMCPVNNIHMVDVPEQGLRPIENSKACQKCGKCIKVCPGIQISHQEHNKETISSLRQAWGPVLEIWEGYASDPEIRHKGSSGGIATALALYCLEKKNSTGTLHIGANPEICYKNTAVFSRSKEELLLNSGSRYSPAAPCEKIEWIQKANRNSVFIGKPCDVAALRKMQNIDTTLNQKVALVVSIFCAGTPSTNGTLSLLKELSVCPEQVEELRYRGCGWPGMTTVRVTGPGKKTAQMTYEKSWGSILSRYTQFRCRLCPDSTGEFADICCGDPWYRKIESDSPGLSLVLVRSERGRKILRGAMNQGYVIMNRVDPIVLAQSQKSLLRKRCHLWGRLIAMRLFFIPIPDFIGFSLFANWCQLSFANKLRSIFGTFRRLLTRKLFISQKRSQ